MREKDEPLTGYFLHIPVWVCCGCHKRRAVAPRRLLLRRLFVMIAGRLGVAGEISDIGCFVFVFDN